MQHPQPFRGVSRENARGELYYIVAASFFRDVYPTSTRLQITHGASFLVFCLLCGLLLRLLLLALYRRVVSTTTTSIGPYLSGLQCVLGIPGAIRE